MYMICHTVFVHRQRLSEKRETLTEISQSFQHSKAPATKMIYHNSRMDENMHVQNGLKRDQPTYGPSAPAVSLCPGQEPEKRPHTNVPSKYMTCHD